MSTKSWVVNPDDEQRHAWDAAELWNESYYLDVVDDGGKIGGYVRVGFYPNLGVVWWTTSMVIAGETSVMSTNYALGLPEAGSLHVTGEGLDAELVVGDPLRSFTVRSTSPALRSDDPAAHYTGDGLVAAELGIDLTWTTTGEAYQYPVATRYEIPCRVEGTVTLDGTEYRISGPGQRDHSWGVRDWWAFGWCWFAVQLDDGTALHGADIRMEGMPIALGYRQDPDGTLHEMAGLEATEEIGRLGMPTSGRLVLQPGGIEVEVEPLAFGPLILVADDGRVSDFPRAMAKMTTKDGRSGLGWIEWNQPRGVS